MRFKKKIHLLKKKKTYHLESLSVTNALCGQKLSKLKFKKTVVWKGEQ